MPSHELREHLMGRHFNPDLYRNIVLDDENQLLTVYLNNLSGQFVGYQQYNPNSTDKRTNFKDEARYYTYRTDGQIAAWGLELLNPSNPVCFVVEGIFKAAILHRLGYNAIAVLCNNPIQMRSWFKAMPYKLFAIGDNDAAGLKLINVIGHGTRLEKDLDEYPLEEVRRVTDHILSVI
ncbi:toprim domain-containing protein [Acinetobacter brisouii]|uniref:toprim domain-containing protein n=1 Tax=Acinetobacter brisouii TaxID=396323 RepID=UPI00124C4E26|nr:toprim domain-containing protein [Acinetobacter brisouii]